MNKRNLNKLIKYIEDSNSFSMHSWHWGEGSMKYYISHSESVYLNRRKKFKKGTPACVGGHFMTMEGFEPDFYYAESIQKGLATFLGVEWTVASGMTCTKREPKFYGADGPFEEKYITKRRALAMLKKLKKTGVVDFGALKTYKRICIRIDEKDYENDEMDFLNLFENALKKTIPNVKINTENIDILGSGGTVIGNIEGITDEVYYLSKNKNCKLNFPLEYWTEVKLW